MKSELFRGSQLKIKRANQHIRELNEILNAFQKTHFYRLSMEDNADLRKNIVTFSVTEEIPSDVPLVIGDAVHNLCTALDHAVYEMLILSGGSAGVWTKFPFEKTRQELEATLQGGTIQRLGLDLITLIMEVIQPYKGGNDPLYGLHDLDIVDKHRLILPVLSFTTLSHVVVASRENTQAVSGDSLKVKPGERLSILFSGSDRFDLKDYGQPTLHVLFDNIEVFKGQPVVPTLHQLSQLVSGIIQKIAETWRARG
jgi:hypothetical protein